jgi:hypothetical protein
MYNSWEKLRRHSASEMVYMIYLSSVFINLIFTVEHFLTVILSLMPKNKNQLEQINNFSLNHLHWKSDKSK